MDTAGKVYLGITVIAIVAAIVGFYFLSRSGPRGSVLVVAGGLFFAGMCVPPNNSRELHLLEGVCRLTGFIGGILGVIDLVRKRPHARQSEAYVAAEIVREKDDGGILLPNVCPRQPAELQSERGSSAQVGTTRTTGSLKMETCPMCGMRVVVKSDGTCPSCQFRLPGLTQGTST
jgi:hypothetical protein